MKMCKKIVLAFIISVMFMSCMIQANCADDYDDPDEISCADRNIITYNGFVEASESRQNNYCRENGDDFDSYGLVGYMDFTRYDSYDPYNSLPRNNACFEWDWGIEDDVDSDLFY